MNQQHLTGNVSLRTKREKQQSTTRKRQNVNSEKAEKKILENAAGSFQIVESRAEDVKIPIQEV